MSKFLPNKTINSAGIAALVGHSADPMSMKVAQENGLSLANHQARQLTRELCLNHDLVLVMEDRHIAHVCRQAPEARGKVLLFGHWLNKQTIPDPYRRDKKTFDMVYNLLQKSAELWSRTL